MAMQQIDSVFQFREPSRPVLYTKRLFDIGIGLVGTIMLVVLYPFLALLIKLESRGPIIYKQNRVGIDRRIRKRAIIALKNFPRKKNYGGKIFTIYKFRSMTNDAEKNGPQLASHNGDSRVTKVGKWLRATHFDELPQFWNILRGDMSFIGPRPERPHFTLEYTKKVIPFKERTLFTKPGLTGLAQIILGYDESLESIVRKSFFDLSYGASLSNFRAWIKVEFWIFLHTFFYLGKRVNHDGTVNIPKSLERIHGLSMEILNDRKRNEGPTTGTVRFQCYNKNFVLSNLSPEELCRKVDMLQNSGQKHISVSVNPSARFDLEDMRFLVNLVHKVKGFDGKLTIRNPHNRVHKILKEVHLDKVVQIEKIRRTIPNILSVDVECWFHAHNLKSKVLKCQWSSLNTRIVKNVRRIIDLMQKHNTSATFFVLGWVADHFPEVVEIIDNAGFEIGTHGYFHNLITEMTQDEFEADLVKSLEALARRTNQKIIGHRGSNFTITKSTLWALDILHKYGLEYDSSIFPIKRQRYGIPDYPNRMPHTIQLDGSHFIKEFPLSTLAIGKKLMPIAGGGYLRLYPYRITDRFVDQMNLAGYPAMIYFHPWELDTEQVRLDVPRMKKFQHYVNLHTTDWKLSHLMERYKFMSVKNAMKTRRIQKLLQSNPVKISTTESKPNSIALKVNKVVSA